MLYLSSFVMALEASRQPVISKFWEKSLCASKSWNKSSCSATISVIYASQALPCVEFILESQQRCIESFRMLRSLQNMEKSGAFYIITKQCWVSLTLIVHFLSWYFIMLSSPLCDNLWLLWNKTKPLKCLNIHYAVPFKATVAHEK